MSYLLRWVQEALDELAAAWLRATATEREQIVVQSDQIECLLSENPYGVSESRPGGKRIAFFLPLVAIFRIEPDDQTVTVLHVHFVRSGRN